jgi:biotin transport system substrate-specific component
MNSGARTLDRSWNIAEQTILVQALWVAGFAAATALAARVEIPHQPVPFTLQTMVVLLAGAFLGPRNGAISQLLYLGAGALGLPVFAGGAPGFLHLIGPTGGYLLAFPAAAAITGFLVTQGRSLFWTAVSMTVGLVVIFTSGTIHLYAFYIHNLASAFSAGFLIFSWWDMLKLGAASMIYHEIAKRWPRVGNKN